MMPKHNQKTIMPIQPIEKDVDKTKRFVPNRIVRMLLDTGIIDLGDIAKLDFTDQERMQFAQLIGYSLCGFGELSYVDDVSYEAAEIMASELDAEYEKIKKSKEVEKKTVVNVFIISSDNLVS